METNKNKNLTTIVVVIVVVAIISTFIWMLSSSDSNTSDESANTATGESNSVNEGEGNQNQSNNDDTDTIPDNNQQTEGDTGNQDQQSDPETTITPRIDIDKLIEEYSGSGRTPPVWDSLSTADKIRINPYGCLDTTKISAEDGRCISGGSSLDPDEDQDDNTDSDDDEDQEDDPPVVIIEEEKILDIIFDDTIGQYTARYVIDGVDRTARFIFHHVIVDSASDCQQAAFNDGSVKAGRQYQTRNSDFSKYVCFRAADEDIDPIYKHHFVRAHGNQELRILTPLKDRYYAVYKVNNRDIISLPGTEIESVVIESGVACDESTDFVGNPANPPLAKGTGKYTQHLRSDEGVVFDAYAAIPPNLVCFRARPAGYESYVYASEPLVDAAKKGAVLNIGFIYKNRDHPTLKFGKFAIAAVHVDGTDKSDDTHFSSTIVESPNDCKSSAFNTKSKGEIKAGWGRKSAERYLYEKDESGNVCFKAKLTLDTGSTKTLYLSKPIPEDADKEVILDINFVRRNNRRVAIATIHVDGVDKSSDAHFVSTQIKHDACYEGTLLRGPLGDSAEQYLDYSIATNICFEAKLTLDTGITVILYLNKPFP